MIVRPGVDAVSAGTLLVLASTIFAAITRLMAKSLAHTDSSRAIVAWDGEPNSNNFVPDFVVNFAGDFVSDSIDIDSFELLKVGFDLPPPPIRQLRF